MSMLQPEGSTKVSFGAPSLSAKAFDRLSALVLQLSGIHLTTNKRVLLESRLRPRLRELGLSSFEAYAELLEGKGAAPSEQVLLVESITTHKTDFFREPDHFRILEEHLSIEAASGHRRVSIWSAACSSGQEPYSMAMVAEDLVKAGVLASHTVLATDISSQVLQVAKNAIYPHAMIEPVGHERRKRYLLRSHNRARDLVKVAPQLRSRVRFEQLNLTTSGPSGSPSFSAVFCRNVLIYFEPEVQRKVAKRLLSYLRPNGLLFLGHAESSAARELGADVVAPTVFRRGERL